MNGEVPPTNQRLTSPAFRNASALQGASVAFLASRNQPVILPSSHHHAQLRHQDMPESGPEIGSVRDKIGRLNSMSPPPVSSRVRPPPSPSPRPELLAARFAAEKSHAAKQASANDAARLGALRSASRVQPRPVPPPRPSILDRPDLRSPIPIRPRRAPESMDQILRDDITSSDPGPRYSPALRSRAGSLRSQASSTQSSRLATASTKEEPKPRVPPRSMTPSGDYPRKTVPSSSSASLASTSELSQRSSPSAVTSMADDSNRIREEALSNAIIASSLASSRASPATNLPPPVPRRRRALSKSILQLAHSKNDSSRTPSPPKGMPQTLRGVPKPDDEEEARRRHKMRLVHKHPHKHHEGDRKRWRREVTEKERKRYEGVWASNKGLHIPPSLNTQTRAQKWPPPSEMVLNLVVQEIWSRSRLGPAVLEKVWDLVDHQHNGLLTKEEFVVGMWLIDQQLKGHKLPNKVPDSVWDSVRYVTGIKLSSTGR